MTLISGGDWSKTGFYEGSKKAQGILVSDDIRYEELKKKISEKVYSEMYELTLRYIAPQSNGNIPALDVNDEDDLATFKYLNMKSCEDGVWPISLYASSTLKGGKISNSELFGNVGNSGASPDEIDGTMSSPPQPTQATQHPGTEQRVSRSLENPMVGNPLNNDRSIDEIIDDDITEDEEAMGEDMLYDRRRDAMGTSMLGDLERKRKTPENGFARNQGHKQLPLKMSCV